MNNAETEEVSNHFLRQGKWDFAAIRDANCGAPAIKLGKKPGHAFMCILPAKTHDLLHHCCALLCGCERNGCSDAGITSRIASCCLNRLAIDGASWRQCDNRLA